MSFFVVIQGYFRPNIVWNWWKQEKGVSGLSLGRTCPPSRPIQLFEVTDSKTAPISRHRVTVSPQGMKLVKLPELLTWKH